MPEKHFYFALGAAAGSAICVVIAKARHKLRETNNFVRWLYRKEPHWFLYFPMLIFVIGLWGLIPDIIHLLGILPKDVTRSAIFDIFFFHTTFEHIEDTQPMLDRYLNFLGQFLLLTICLSVMSYYVSQVKKALKRHCKKEKADGL